MTHPSGLAHVVEDARVNAALGWLLVGVLLAVAGGWLLGGEPLWAGFALAVAAIALVPPVAYRRSRAMLPWEVLALASLPLVARAAVAGQTVLGVTLAGRVTTHFAVAAVALLVAVELDVFTPVRMNHAFAVAFVVVATLAAAGVWAVVQWLSDLLVGTTLIYPESPSVPATVRDGGLLDRLAWLSDLFVGTTVLDAEPLSVPPGVDHRAHVELMWDFVAATGVGLLAGLTFEHYFRRFARTGDRVPDAAGSVGESGVDEAEREVDR